MTHALYIGVAGLLAKDIAPLASFYEELTEKWSSNRKIPLLFLGLQTSRKFLNGEDVNPFYAKRMNSMAQIADAFETDFIFSSVIVHYNPSGGYNLPGVSDHLSSIKRTGCGGIQWNGFSSRTTPETTPVLPYTTESCGLTSILQIGKEDYEDPEGFIERVKMNPVYKDSTHLLLDGSGGRSVSIDEAGAIRWIKVLLDADVDKGLALSGGLGAGNLQILTRVRKEFGYEFKVSIDAEGKLMENGEFSVEKAKAYIEEALTYYV